MAGSLPSIREEMLRVVGRIVGDGPLPDDLRRQALAICSRIVDSPDGGNGAGNGTATAGTAADSLVPAGPVADTGTRRLIYVHGICRHAAGYSDSWWAALRPFLPGTFGDGWLGDTRLEIVWSDLVNGASAMLAAQASRSAPPLASGGAQAMPREVADWQQASAEVKEALRDRADQATMTAQVPLEIVPHTEGVFEPAANQQEAAGISIPGINCIDDFAIYLTNESTRQQILNRFINVVRPQLQAGRTLDIVAHSWGTVVAYEGLCQLADEGLTAPRVHNLFTVGAALSIPPVKMRLRPANRDGRKPANTRRWVNLDARGDPVGGPLKNRPFAVDEDIVNLTPVGCNGGLLVNPQCAHSSYFDSSNRTVNRDIFASRIMS
jgi:hypothetical protein